jgi:hypothetical protein
MARVKDVVCGMTIESDSAAGQSQFEEAAPACVTAWSRAHLPVMWPVRCSMTPRCNSELPGLPANLSRRCPNRIDCADRRRMNLAG